MRRLLVTYLLVQERTTIVDVAGHDTEAEVGAALAAMHPRGDVEIVGTELWKPREEED